MKQISPFTGFPSQFFIYFLGLEQNNTRSWFHAHKEQLDEYVMGPSRSFVVELGARLMSISPYIYAEPKVNRSLFRIARDTRRQKDLPPYKNHQAFLFWEGGLGKLENAGFYMSLSKDRLELGSGIYRFAPKTLHKYREAVVHEKHGKELSKIIADLAKHGYRVGGHHYKRYPRGFSATDLNSDLLLHNGLYVFEEIKIPKIVHSHEFLDFVFEKYLLWSPLHNWLADLLRRGER